MSTRGDERSSEQRQHAARMFAWEDQVARDHGLKKWPFALHVVVVLRKKMDGRTGLTPRVDYQWLARQIGISRRCVQYSVKALVKQSHLEVTSGQAAGVGNVYRAKVKDGAGTVVPTPSEGHAPVCRPGRHHDARGAGTTVPTSTSSLSLSNSGSGLPGFMKKIPATRRANSDAGQIQKDIAARLGANGWEIVMSLEESEVDQLCAQQRAGTLSEASLAEIKLVYEASQSARSALLKRSVG